MIYTAIRNLRNNSHRPKPISDNYVHLATLSIVDDNISISNLVGIGEESHSIYKNCISRIQLSYNESPKNLYIKSTARNYTDYTC